MTLADCFVIRINWDGVINYISPTVVNVLGYQDKEMIGKTCKTFIIENGCDKICEFFESYPTLDASTHTYNIRTKSGQVKRIESSIVILKDPKTKVRKEMLAFSKDVTPRWKLKNN